MEPTRTDRDLGGDTLTAYDFAMEEIIGRERVIVLVQRAEGVERDNAAVVPQSDAESASSASSIPVISSINACTVFMRSRMVTANSQRFSTWFSNRTSLSKAS
jgi:hypothetical protein